MNVSDLKCCDSRELSLLKFNQRVLFESLPGKHNVIERIKYIKIFRSNSKEFFSVRVGKILNRLTKLSPKDLKEKEEIQELFQSIFHLQERNLAFETKCYDKILEELEEKKVKVLKEVEEKLAVKVLKVLTPYLGSFDTKFLGHGDSAFFKDNQIYLITETKRDGIYGICQVPSALPKAVTFENDGNLTIIPLDIALLSIVKEIFPGKSNGKATLFKAVRNLDINLNRERANEDAYPLILEKNLQLRQLQEIGEISYFPTISQPLRKYLFDKSNCFTEFFFKKSVPFFLNFDDIIEDFFRLKKIKYKNSFKEKLPPVDDQEFVGKSIMELAEKRDLLFSYPYNSSSGFFKLLSELSSPQVKRVKTTIYRVCENSSVVDALIKCAESGKDVEAIVELQARFDEERNLEVVRRLSESGVRVSYGKKNFKVHSKLLAVEYENEGVTKQLTLVGTGNFNEDTQKLYSDFQIVTSDRGVFEDVMKFFEIFSGGQQDNFEKLLVSPINLKNEILSLIDREIKKGTKGRIILKMNGFNSPDVFAKLVEASKNGVDIDLIVRGAMVLVPGIKDVTENIKVHSLVGKFLEHERVFSFGSGKTLEIIISSADLMTRNLEKRFEVAMVVEDNKIKRKLQKSLNYCLKDTVNHWIMEPDKSYKKLKSKKNFDSQRRKALDARLKNKKILEREKNATDKPITN